MTTSSHGTIGAAGQIALDKLEAAEALARFYAAVQRYDCDGTDWEAITELIADEMVYLTPNLDDPRPATRDEFLRHFKELHDVHAHGRRGSYYALTAPVVTIKGDAAHITANIAICHWLSPATEHSTWFYGSLAADLSRDASGWRLTMLDTTKAVRVEGHSPPVNAFHPHLEGE